MNKNLENYMNSISEEERKANARKAGEASGEARRKKKLWKESVELITSGILTEEVAAQVREKFGIEADVELTHQDQIIAALAEKAQKGDKDSAQFLRDTVGQNPTTMIKLGNLEDKPFKTLDLSGLSDEELKRLAEREQPED